LFEFNFLIEQDKSKVSDALNDDAPIIAKFGSNQPLAQKTGSQLEAGPAQNA
tara:strand:+ start:163 stop:318 length:156 start_codon:yes stop_codon:yes gene_type:complete